MNFSHLVRNTACDTPDFPSFLKLSGIGNGQKAYMESMVLLPKLILVPFPMCICGFLHQQAIFGHQQGVLQLTKFWHYLSRFGINFYRLRLQSYKTAPSILKTPLVSPRCYLCFWPTGCRLEVPMDLLLGLQTSVSHKSRLFIVLMTN